jgi:hypothetical protein
MRKKLVFASYFLLKNIIIICYYLRFVVMLFVVGTDGWLLKNHWHFKTK